MGRQFTRMVQTTDSNIVVANTRVQEEEIQLLTCRDQRTLLILARGSLNGERFSLRGTPLLLQLEHLICGRPSCW